MPDHSTEVKGRVEARKVDPLLNINTDSSANNDSNKNNIFNFDDEVVISGISGRFPECDNIEEFREKLFEGVDLVTADDRRWPLELWGLPKRAGKLKDISKFDASFFGVREKQAHLMDPQLRILIESTYEAIVDAGINPSEIRGSNTGVFIATSASDGILIK